MNMVNEGEMLSFVLISSLEFWGCYFGLAFSILKFKIMVQGNFSWGLQALSD